MKKLKKEIKKLPLKEQNQILEQIKERPNMFFGIQKSLLKGFSDLPLFKSVSEDQQTNLF